MIDSMVTRLSARAARGAGRGRDPRPGLAARVLRFIREKTVLHESERVLVAVSGGPDSTALLLVLAAIAPRLSLDLRAAYFDHGLRGEEAMRRERAFVEELAGKVRVDLRVGAGDVRLRSRGQRLSLEQAGREMRYGFLAQTAVEEGCSVVATGHTADDQVETVLLHLLRGSGLDGLTGMAPRSVVDVAGVSVGAPALARPLLTLKRADTEAYCRAAGLSPIEDASNRSRAFLRNRVRLELLPLLRGYNPCIDDALLQLSEAAGHDMELIEKLAEEVLCASSSEASGRLTLSRRRLTDLPAALQRHVMRLALRRLLGHLRDVQASHVEALVRALHAPSSHHLDLPHGVSLDVGYDEAVLAAGTALERHRVPPETPLAVPGRLRWGPWSIQAEVGPLEGAPPEDPFRAWLDAEALGAGLVVRSRRRGDRFQPLGMAEDKKLQDLLVDEHVPRRERDLVPLVCSARGIAWVGGVRIAHWARVREGTQRILKLRLRRGDWDPP